MRRTSDRFESIRLAKAIDAWDGKREGIRLIWVADKSEANQKAIYDGDILRDRAVDDLWRIPLIAGYCYYENLPGFRVTPGRPWKLAVASRTRCFRNAIGMVEALFRSLDGMKDKQTELK